MTPDTPYDGDTTDPVVPFPEEAVQAEHEELAELLKPGETLPWVATTPEPLVTQVIEEQTGDTEETEAGTVVPADDSDDSDSDAEQQAPAPVVEDDNGGQLESDEAKSAPSATGDPEGDTTLNDEAADKGYAK